MDTKRGSRRRYSGERRRKLSSLPEGRSSRARREPSTSLWVVEEIEHEADQAPPEPAPEKCPGIAPPLAFPNEEVIRMFSLLHGDKAKSSHLSSNQLNNVISEFDPASKAQNVDSWIRKVNECAGIYEWNEKQTIHFALQKLAGLSKKWFESLPSVIFSWDEWQSKLRKAFPNEQNYGRLLEEMLARTTLHNESYREYFYDKLTLLNRCGIVGKKAVDCVIHGIIDKSVRDSAQAMNCEEPEDLLAFLNSQRHSDTADSDTPLSELQKR